MTSNPFRIIPSNQFTLRMFLFFVIWLLDTALLGRSVLDLGDFGPSDEEILDQTQVRSFFPETWIYDETVVG